MTHALATVCTPTHTERGSWRSGAKCKTCNVVKRERDKVRVHELLEQLKAVARDESANIMLITIELVFGLG